MVQRLALCDLASLHPIVTISDKLLFVIHWLQRADQNSDGLLTPDEYYQILVDHGVECSREEIRDIIRQADQDHDG